MTKKLLTHTFSLVGILLLCGAIIGCAPATSEPEPVAVEAEPREVVAEPLPDPTEPAEAEISAPATPTAQPTLPAPSVAEEGGEEAGSDNAQAAAPDAAPARNCDRPWPNESFGYGIQSHAVASAGDPAKAMDDVANKLGMQWVKVQFEWWLVQPGEVDRQWFFYDGAVEQANAQGLCLMLSIVGSPDYLRAANNHVGPPDDYNEFAKFLDELLNRYPGQIHAIEVWNEMNLDREWQTANGVNPEDYTRFLQISYDKIKSIDPNIIVISGALSPTGGGDGIAWLDDFQWMDRAIAAGMLNYTDCVGAHHNGYNIPPNIPFDQTNTFAEASTAVFRGPFDNPHHSWSFKTTLDTYASKIQAVNPNLKLCVTEFGWATVEGYDTYPPGFEFAQDNTLQEQSDWIIQAFQQMRDSGDVWIAFVFNFDFGNKGGGPTDDTVPYSILDTNGAPRPAFDALAAMDKTR